MANLTKAQRAEREAQRLEQIRAEAEANAEEKLRAEYDAKFASLMSEFVALKKELETKQENTVVGNKEIVESKLETAKRIQQASRIPLDTLVPVISNTTMKLIYVSKKTMGYTVEWEEMGAVEYIELGELATMKNTDKRFFEDNWIVLGETEDYTPMQFYDFLKVSKFYKNVFTPENIDEIFTYSKDKIVKTLSTLSRGMKDTIAVRAKQKLDNDTLDKNIVDTLESSLGIQFTI